MILTIHRHVITRLARFSVSHDNAMTWLLHVSQVQQEDRGYYMCQFHQISWTTIARSQPWLSERTRTSAWSARRMASLHPRSCGEEKMASPSLWTGGRKRISRTEMGAYLCIATNAVPPSVSKRIINSQIRSKNL
ncbi:putative neural cell adhesion molecule l1 [Operophtera brumata]|uniref:Putative neural cell adhesion molecule l1 n=1 Tax=Operophtera brumata TaxID=104452 RepID=A0A0L7LKU2_OPEBR|nr:putative neural cell adhesion molecule l1 [Operophtera brumata]